MATKPTNVLRGVAIGLLLAGGMGATRVIEGAQKSLQKLSTVIAVNVASLRAVADADHDEAMDDEMSIAKENR
jgi:hypothetical protein